MLQTVPGPDAGFDLERIDGLAPAERRVAHFLVEAGPDVLVLERGGAGCPAGDERRHGGADGEGSWLRRHGRAAPHAGRAATRASATNGGTNPPLALRLQRTLADSRPDQLLATSVAEPPLRFGQPGSARHAEAFAEAVGVLGAGERIVWRGIEPSACLADYGRLLCERVGRRAAAWSHTGTAFADELAGLAGGDVVVALAYGRLQNHVHALIDHAAALGAATVLITDVANPGGGA